MFTPKYPKPDTAPPLAMTPAPAPVPLVKDVAPASEVPAQVPQYISAPAAPARPTIQLTPGALIALAGGGTIAVLVVGTVLVSMLLAVAITGASVAVCAVVVRSLLVNQNRKH